MTDNNGGNGEGTGDGKDIVLYGDDIIIRRFVKEDASQFIEFIGTILVEFGFTPDASNDKDFNDIESAYKSGELFVACEKTSGKIIGSAGYRKMHGCDESARPLAELRRLYVSSSYRRRGLGGMLLAAIEFRAYTAGFPAMILESASQLKSATRLYEARGYEHCDLPSPDRKTQRCDVVMQKTLDIIAAKYTSVQVVNENGHLFASIPQVVARRGAMRFATFTVLDLWNDKLVKRPNICMQPKSADSSTPPGTPNLSLVQRNLICDDSENRFCCDLYIVRLPRTQTPPGQWISVSESLNIFQSNKLYVCILQSLAAFLNIHKSTGLR